LLTLWELPEQAYWVNAPLATAILEDFASWSARFHLNNADVGQNVEGFLIHKFGSSNYIVELRAQHFA
jgi:hypothetical protein